jgi:hypothetical protein
MPREGPKIKLKNMAHFLRPKNWMSENHVYHAIHHTHTTFSPRFVAGNREKPLQNTIKATAK